MKILLKIFLFFCLITSTHSQNIIVHYNKNTFYVPTVMRNELEYFSLKQFLQLFHAKSSFNVKSEKNEAYLGQKKLVVTGKNSFVEIMDLSNHRSEIIQIPISSLLLNNEIFLPAIYSTNFLSKFLNAEIKYEDNEFFIESIIEEKNLALPNLVLPEVIPQKPAYDIEKIEIDEKANGTLIRLKANRKNIPFKSSIQKNKLFVFFNDISFSPDITQQVATNDFIKKIELKNLGKSIQLEFTLETSVPISDSLLESVNDFESNDILISIFNKQLDQTNYDPKIKEWKFDTIVIDAGHGGKDAGAIGITDVKEKDINLSIGLKLGKLIKNNLPDIKVVYTRQTDNFVELYKRGKIANENNGKLFISIHCNSQSKKQSSSRGFEVYLLRPGKTKQAIEIAQFENSVIKYEDDPTRYKELTDENFILVSMAHSSYMRYSERFSEILHKNWNKNISIPTRGVKQAGFYVLVGASMPSVLIETGFLSNPQDESILKSAKGQQNIVNSIFLAIKNFKQYYDQELEK